MIYFGTSGFSYTDWVGPVYPKGMRRQNWFDYYSNRFNALELNTTYYAIPSLMVVKSLVDRAGDGFQFAIKAHQDITHGRQPEESTFSAFIEILKPFSDTGKLGCILLQFPYNFFYNQTNQDYLEQIRKKFSSFPVVVELRNALWIKAEVFQWLKERELGFCCVDEPHLPKLMPPVAKVTSEIGYIRFHGRNAAKWWQPVHAYERYDYTYSDEELEEWVPRIKKINTEAEKTFVFANNHWRGQSVDTIRQLKLMLD
jgi:uncharacterized protein YecE (DUF72 family)